MVFCRPPRTEKISITKLYGKCVLWYFSSLDLQKLLKKGKNYSTESEKW